MERRSYPTIKELALEAGVSTMTASRAIHQPHKVKPSTRSKVMEAARRINYRPNTVAQALSRGRTNIIYVYVPSDIAGDNPFYLDVVGGICERLGELGYSVLLRKKWYGGEPCDGIVLMGLGKSDEENALKLSKEKQVVVFGHLDGADCIDVDNRLGMKMIAEYLVKSGKKKILYLSIDSDRDFVSDREKGFLQAVEGRASYGIWKIDNDMNSSYRYFKANFDSNEGYDAVCASSDELALGAAAYLREMGIKVPEDISLTGFDGLGRELLTHPRLTTIRQPILEIGKQISSRLVDKIEKGEERAEKTFVPPMLIVNGTVK